MAGILGVIGSLLGGITGMANPRPPSLSPVQSQALNSLIPSLQQGAQATPAIDQTQQNLMYGNVAANQTGANNAAIHSLTAAGLGHSGLLGGALTQVANQAQQSRNQGNMGLQQQAVQRQQFDIQSLIQSLNVNNTPGQSPFGAFTAGMAPVAAYSLQNYLNNNQNNGQSMADIFGAQGKLTQAAGQLPGAQTQGTYDFGPLTPPTF